MPSNLDRSLDEIAAPRTRTNRRGGNKAAGTSGIRKRPRRAATQKANAPVLSGKVSASKIIVSNLVCPTLVATSLSF